MATISLRDASLRAALGLRHDDGSEIISKLSRWRRQRRGYLDRAVMRDRVLLAVEDGGGRPMSRLDIARAVDRAKGPEIVGIINELVSEGLLDVSVQPYRATGRYVYTLSSEGALYARSLR